MSRATKRKHVTREVLEDFVVPTGEQRIVRVVCGRGNNLHEVEAPSGDHFLASMPTKFRKNVWIKRGDFVVVEPIAEGHKVQAEIAHILYPAQVKHLKQENLWPTAFEDKKMSDMTATHHIAATGVGPPGDDNASDEEEDELFVNTNHPPPPEYEPSDSSGSDSQED